MARHFRLKFFSSPWPIFQKCLLLQQRRFFIPPPLHSALQLLTILGYADIILEHSARYVRLDCSIQRWPFPSLSPCRVLRLYRTNDTHHAPSAGRPIETLHLSVIRPLLLLQTFISCLFIRTFLIYYSTGEPSSSEALSSRRCLSRQSA